MITMLKSKLHRAVVTEADVNYVGSITIDNLNYHDNEIEIKKRIAFLTGNTKLYKDLSAYELLTMCGNYYHMSKKEIKDRIRRIGRIQKRKIKRTSS